MRLVEEILRLRDCGKVICAVNDREASDRALELEDLIKIGLHHGLQGDSTLIKAISRTEAVRILNHLFAVDLAYNQEIMPFLVAEALAIKFVDLFTEPAFFATNATFKESEKHGFGLHSWSPLTTATFDAGVLCASQSRAGLFWVEDED